MRTKVQKLWLDLETYSEVPISYGTDVYTDACEILLFLYAIDDGDVSCVDLTIEGEELPEDLVHAIETADEIWASNSYFDRSVLRKCLPQFDWSVERWRDTMIQAAEHGLPASLGGMGQAMKLPQELLKLDGSQYIHLFCKPRPKNHKLRRATRLTHPIDWQNFIIYGVTDVKAMRAAHKAMPKINYPNNKVELELWHLDQHINDRGVQIDMHLVEGAIAAVKQKSALLKQETKEKTEDKLDSTTKRDKLLSYILDEYGLDLEDLKKSTAERILSDDSTPDGVKALIKIRLQAGASSTSKFSKIKQAVGKDGRCRGTLQFCGAKRTGRAAGRIIQPQNLPSRGLLSKPEIEFGIMALKDGDAIEWFPDVMKLLVSVIRGAIVCEHGHKLVVSDLSNIEGRVAAWITEEEWKLEAFRAFDDGTGPDLYNLAYANSFKVDVESVNKSQRAIGKVQELMLGYGGGVGAFVTGALGYGFDLEDLSKKIWETLPEDQVMKARDFLEWARKQKMPTYDLSDEAFITCDVLKRLWREANPNISSYWRKIEDTMVAAINQPGVVFDCGPHIKVKKTGAWLRVRLPSGRTLNYPSASCEEGLKFFGENPISRKWQRLRTWGGTVFENICQATAREVIFWSMLRAEEAGYPVVMHVHDELVTEVPDTPQYSEKELSRILAAGESWTKGLPLAAAGFEDKRYGK